MVEVEGVVEGCVDGCVDGGGGGGGGGGPYWSDVRSVVREGCFAKQWTTSTERSCKNHPLSGLTTNQLVRVLVTYGRHVDYNRYGHRILFLLLLSVFNSLLAAIEWLLYERKINRTKINPNVVFVIGQPRTGTTHVHNLLSQDTETFTFASTFDVGFPSSFLWTGGWLPKLLKGMISETRPMDNMKLSFDLPQEDELATNMLSGGVSPYMAIAFLKRSVWEKLLPLWTLELESGCSKDQKEKWKESFLYFCRKLQLRAGPNKRLLLKSPVHTARVSLLLEIFPNAKFVMCHRNPYAIFTSSVNMAQKYYSYSALCSPSSEDMLQYVLEQFVLMHEKYIADKSKLVQGVTMGSSSSKIIEVRYSALDENPLETVTEIYRTLELNPDGFPIVEKTVKSYLEQLKGFKTNDFKPLPRALKALVKRHWRLGFLDFGYDFEDE